MESTASNVGVSYVLSAHYTETALRFGGGMVFPTSNNFIVRLDCTHTSYPELSLVAPPKQELERFRTKDDLFRIGLLHQFDPKQFDRFLNNPRLPSRKAPHRGA